MSNAGKVQDPSRQQFNDGGAINGPPQPRKRGGDERTRPRDRKRGGAAYKRSRKTTIIGPASAILSTVTTESTAGLRGCVGSWGVGDLGTMRLRSSE